MMILGACLFIVIVVSALFSIVSDWVDAAADLNDVFADEDEDALL